MTDTKRDVLEASLQSFATGDTGAALRQIPELVEEIRRLRKGLAEIGGEWDPHIRPSGSNEIWVAEIAARARALLPDTENPDA